MKNLIYSTIFALTTTIGLPIVAQAQDIEFDPSAARIVDTEIDRNEDAHVITLYTGARPLSYVVLIPPEELDLSDDIEVVSEPGQILNAVAVDLDNVSRTYNANIANENDEIAIDEEVNIDQSIDPRVIVTFANPIPARTTVQIALKDLQPLVPNGNSFFNYQIAGKHVGLTEPIPYGLARFRADNFR